MSNEEKNSANQENQTTTPGTVSNTANATASGGSTAIATAGNNNRVSSTITQTHGDTGEWLKTEMGKWLQKADELIESKDDLEDVKKNIERIAGEIDKNGEQADEKRIEQAFLKIWNMSKDVGKVILSGLTGGPLAVVKKVAHLIQQRIDTEKQEPG